MQMSSGKHLRFVCAYACVLMCTCLPSSAKMRKPVPWTGRSRRQAGLCSCGGTQSRHVYCYACPTDTRTHAQRYRCLTQGKQEASAHAMAHRQARAPPRTHVQHARAYTRPQPRDVWRCDTCTHTRRATPKSSTWPPILGPTMMGRPIMMVLLDVSSRLSRPASAQCFLQNIHT